MKEEKIDLDIMKSVWFNPTQTTRQFLDKNSWWTAAFIVALSSLSQMFMTYFNSVDDPNVKSVYELGWFSFLIGPLLTPLAFWISSFTIWLISRLFRGKATIRQTYLAMAVPALLSIPLLPILAGWFVASPDSFVDPYHYGGIDLFATLVAMILLIVNIWSFFTSIAAIAEANKIGKWQAFFVLIIPISLLIVVILVILSLFFVAVI